MNTIIIKAKRSKSETITQRTNQNNNEHNNYSSEKHNSYTKKQCTEYDKEGNKMSKIMNE